MSKFVLSVLLSVRTLHTANWQICRNAASGSNYTIISGKMAIAVEEVKQLRQQIQEAEFAALKTIYLFSNAGIDNSKQVPTFLALFDKAQLPGIGRSSRITCKRKPTRHS